MRSGREKGGRREEEEREKGGRRGQTFWNLSMKDSQVNIFTWRIPSTKEFTPLYVKEEVTKEGGRREGKEKEKGEGREKEGEGRRKDRPSGTFP
jgi:hypothetical protein